ncbi:PfkB family carbohydrate kinase [Undibacterium sp. Ji83W]|uniref:PfkB family carbohydrate kinase n=1 Tax=Undibacterium sp. Ji83W TaxID=3413043 RepID=UPI003BF0852B
MTTLKIAGGIYREICQFPERREILGSGGRAAAALSEINDDIELHGFAPADEQIRFEIQSSLAVYNFHINLYDSTNFVAFRWLYGLASPQQEPTFGPGEKEIQMAINGDVILRYGMVEGNAVVNADVVVYDPQAPLRAQYFTKNGSTAKNLAYIINSSEAKLLTDQTDPYKQLKQIHELEKAAVVVLKQGPHGAIVSDGIRTSRIPCFKTPNVWSIGSGDVFSAVFTHYWGIKNMSPENAAYKASLATAFYCNAAYLPLPLDFAASFVPNPCVPTVQLDGRRKIYLAGPFFTVAQRWLIDSLRETFLRLNIDVFSPIHDVGEGPANIVAKDDLAGIVKCDVVFAVCDGLDAGTLFELGYAVSIGRPVVAFTQIENESDLTMLRGTNCMIEKDLDTAIYKAIWLALEK